MPGDEKRHSGGYAIRRLPADILTSARTVARFPRSIPQIIGISIGGLFEQWSPLRLTNYSVDISAGAGTVQVLGSSSLVNSTLRMEGPNDNLLNEGLMTLQNSALDIDGSISGSGMILATGSTVAVVSSTPIKDAYQQPLTKQQHRQQQRHSHRLRWSNHHGRQFDGQHGRRSL